MNLRFSSEVWVLKLNKVTNMSSTNDQKAVFPVKFKAINKRTQKEVLVLSSTVVNTSADNDGQIMVLYTDGLNTMVKTAGEFNQNYHVVSAESENTAVTAS